MVALQTFVHLDEVLNLLLGLSGRHILTGGFVQMENSLVLGVKGGSHQLVYKVNASYFLGDKGFSLETAACPVTYNCLSPHDLELLPLIRDLLLLLVDPIAKLMLVVFLLRLFALMYFETEL